MANFGTKLIGNITKFLKIYDTNRRKMLLISEIVNPLAK